jgi:hypothetical protein
MQQFKTRIALIVLNLFVLATAVEGALFVIPTLPRDWLNQGALDIFPDYTIPALALGVVCGGSALVAAAGVLFRPRFGAAASVVAGLTIIGFEAVEILVVGLSMLQYPTAFQSYLQELYLLVGIATVLLGFKLRAAGPVPLHRLA